MESPAGLTAEICAAGNKCPWNTNDGMERASREERGRTDGRTEERGGDEGWRGGGGRSGSLRRCCGYSPEEKFALEETAAAAESWLRPSPARRGGG